MLNQQSSNLDLLRATAVSLVFLSHLFDTVGILESPTNRAWGLWNLGVFGVLMFFIHTSLVLMMSLERLSAGDGPVAAQFYVRRFFRIYPLSMLTVVTLSALRIGTASPLMTKGIILSNLFLVQNLTGVDSISGPMWSLPFEVQMYILLPFLYLAARRIRTYSAALLLIGGGIIVWRAELLLVPSGVYRGLLQYAPWFAMGIAAYSLSRRILPTWSGKWFVAALAALVILPLFTFRFLSYELSSWLIKGFGVLFAFGLPHFHDIPWRMVQKAVHTIAKYSYGIYLCHVPIFGLCFLKLHTKPFAVQAGLCLVLVTITPVLLYHLVESPLINVGARIARQMGAHRSPLAARAGV